MWRGERQRLGVAVGSRRQGGDYVASDTVFVGGILPHVYQRALEWDRPTRGGDVYHKDSLPCVFIAFYGRFTCIHANSSCFSVSMFFTILCKFFDFVTFYHGE